MILASGMRRLLTLLLSSTTKELVQLGAGLAAVIGGVLAVVTFAVSSGGRTATPSLTPVSAAVVEATATAAPTLTPVPLTPTVTPIPPAPTLPAGILDVQFGTVQNKSNGLPGGSTVRPGDSIEACSGTELIGWVRHSFATGAMLKGTWSSQGAALYTNVVSADQQYPTVFFSVFVKDPGVYTLDFQADKDVPVRWNVEVTCKG